MCTAVHITPSDTVLEIGPGEGVLTELLLATGATVIAIEKDASLIPRLQERFAKEIAQKKCILLEQDILSFSPEQSLLANTSYKLIANIPYYITGAIVEQFLSTVHQPTDMVLLVQKEVAVRMSASTAHPKNKKMSILSVAIQAYGTVEYITTVPAGAFVPAPSIDSAIVAIRSITRDFFIDCDEVLFFELLKKLFGQKRKQLFHTLKECVGDSAKTSTILEASEIPPTTRPETLSLQQWKILTQFTQKYR